MTPETAPLPAGARVTIPEHVLFQEVSGQAALLHLDTEVYYGLDDVGTEMWKAIEAESGDIDAALLTLRSIYDVDPATLRADLSALIRTLEQHELMAVKA